MKPASLSLITSILLCLSHTAIASNDMPDYKAEKIAKHTWVIHGPIATPNAINKGFMNNPAFVITSKSVIVLDPGSSRQAGEMVLRQIRKLSNNPVTHVFSSHIHGDHWLGNQAIKNAYPDVKIYAHPKMIELAQAGEAESWVKLMELLTKGSTSGTKAVIPDTPLTDQQEIVVDGITFRAHLSDHAHTKTDAMIEIANDSVMVLGDNVLNLRLGRMDDGSFRGNMKACNTARATSSNTFIPGHGPSGNAANTLTFCDYLNTVYTEVGKHSEAGLSDFEMKPLILRKVQAFKNWQGFEESLGKHISIAALEYEAATFE